MLVLYDDDIMKKIELIHIGTSGWHYKHWKGPFYPEDLSEKDCLDYYAEHFHTVEINNSFYRLPQTKTLLTWRDTVPENFIFSVKASRYITHMKKLKDPQQSLNTFFERIMVLGNKMGPILFQLPPFWHFNIERLKAFLIALPKKYYYAFEFRDPTWFNNQTYRALFERGAAFCIYDLAGRLSPKEITADFIYIRLHGPKGPYQGQYTPECLSGWAEDFSQWIKKDYTIFCYFDNDQFGYAVHDALTLQNMLTN